MHKCKLESDLQKCYITITAVLKKQMMDIQKEIEVSRALSWSAGLSLVSV